MLSSLSSWAIYLFSWFIWVVHTIDDVRCNLHCKQVVTSPLFKINGSLWRFKSMASFARWITAAYGRHSLLSSLTKLTTKMSYIWWKWFLCFQYLPHSVSELCRHRTESRAALGQLSAYQHWRTWFICLLRALLFLSSSQPLQSAGGFQGKSPKENDQEGFIS